MSDALKNEPRARPRAAKGRRFGDGSDAVRGERARRGGAHHRRRRGGLLRSRSHRLHGEPARRLAEGRDAGERVERREPSQRLARETGAPERRFHERHDLLRRGVPAKSHPRDDHRFVTIHCVTGIAARQPCMPPTRSSRKSAKRRIAPPYRA